jgi:PAS domain S-box-containing protein
MTKKIVRKSSPKHRLRNLSSYDARVFSEKSFRGLVQDLHACVVLLGSGGEIQFANQAALDTFGMNEGQVLGKRTEDLGLMVLREDGSEYPMSMRPGARALTSGRPVRGEIWGLRRPNSSEVVWLYGAATPQFARGPSLRGVVITATDVTERRNAAAALQKANELNRQILLSAQEGIVVHDRMLRYTLWNPFMKQITGMKERDVLGKHPRELFPFFAESGISERLEKALAGEITTLLDVPYTIPQTGRAGWCNNNFAPLRGEKGEIVGVVGTVSEVSERKKRESQLKESEALLAQAEELANMGSWELEIESQTLNWSAHFFRMLGLESKGGPVPYGRGIAMIHPDDRERAIRDADQVRTGRLPLDNMLRFVRTDGSERIFHSRAIGTTNQKGRVVRIRGMSQDVTERKHEEERLRRSEAVLSQAEQMTNSGSWELNLKTGKSILSKHLLHVYGLASQADWDRDVFWERIHPEDRERAREIVNHATSECKPFEFVVRYRASDGTYRIHSVRAIQTRGADGQTERSIGVAQDITNQTRVEEELRRLSQELLRARDDERRQVARTLHESAGQTLAGLKMVLGALRRELPDKIDRAHELLESSIELADAAVREVRTLSYLMHPSLLDETGLASALQWYAKGFAQRSGIEVSVEVPEDFGRQSQEIETTVFRIVQEALTNAHLHSGSRAAKIRLTRENEQLRAEVQDHGRGIPAIGSVVDSPVLPGVGIAGMRERVKQLNGIFEIVSAPGHGTTIRVILPLAPPKSLEKNASLADRTDAGRKTPNASQLKAKSARSSNNA